MFGLGKIHTGHLDSILVIEHAHAPLGGLAGSGIVGLASFFLVASAKEPHPEPVLHHYLKVAGNSLEVG